jgi:hydrogenase expression/formation protein HypC
MCLAIPAQVVEIDAAGDTATVALGEVRKQVSLALVDDVTAGDFVLVHVGYALNRISEEEAARTLAVMGEAGLDAADDAAVVP